MRALMQTFPSFSVDDLDAARSFYGKVLGLEVSEVSQQGPLWVHGSGGCDTLVYLKPDHAPATYTVLNFAVADIESAVDELSDRGVSFERYEGLPADDRAIYHGQGHAIAWFTDPAGNNLSVVQEA